MSTVNWDFYKRRIPHRVQVASKVFYEILWVDNFTVNNLGETRYNEKQIVLKNNMSNKLTVITYLHELLHAMSYHHDLGLTETQVLASEKFFIYLLKDSNVFVQKRKGTK